VTRRVFITGGASGLGRALALRYARAGFRVCIGDVHEERGAETLAALRAVAPDAEFVRCDVTREEDLVAVREKLEQRWGGVDVVINNAGVAQAGAIEAVSIEDWRWIIDINLLGVVRGCRVFVPVLKRQQAGHLVNIASMAGLLDVPLMSSYNATKAAVVSLSETLQNELAPHGIGVTVVCPSFFQTNLAESLRTDDPGLRTVMTKLLARSNLTADDVAEAVFRAVEVKEFYVLPHREARAAWRLKRLLPRELYRKAIAKQFRGIQRAAQKERG
jgi:NAD(P)-dependent dehydrogenase (short-subunit alcohol dehydrogenase family)